MIKKISLLLFVTFFSIVFSRPANAKFVKYEQSNGDVVTIRIYGDEHFHYIKSLDGFTLLHNAKGDLEYAKLDEKGDLQLSGVLVKNPENRSEFDRAFLAQFGTKNTFSISQKKYLTELNKTKRAIYKRFLKPSSSNEIKLPVLLIQYKDKKFAHTVQDFEMLMNQENYLGIGCVKDYYKANSFNKMIATSIVGGIYTASNNLAYYGANDANGIDIRPHYLVREAVDSAAKAGIDFSQFDNDKDGYVDVVIVIFAGYGEETGANSNTIWSHSWYLSGDPNDDKSVTYNGVKIDNYTIQPELEGNTGNTICGIGGIVHEFGHALGLPDWYDTDYDEPSTGGQAFDLGLWDVMAAGCWNNNSKTPSNHGAYSKILLGWQTTTELKENQSVNIPNANDNNISFKFYSGNKNEFFLLENRQQVGWDLYIPGHGMLIYHVDSLYINQHWGDNSINVNPNHQGLDLEEADNVKDEVTFDGDPFPGAANKKEFSDYSTPNAKSWDGKKSNKKIFNIKETNGVISFDFALDTVKSVVPKLAFSEIVDNKTYQEEYLEIYNYGTEKVDLEGYIVNERYSANNTSLRTLTLGAAVQVNPNANTILHPGEYAIIVRNDAKFTDFKTKYNLVDTIAYFTKASSLPQINGDERYQLLTPQQELVDQFGVWEYSTTADFRVTSGYCYERKDFNLSGDIESSWVKTSNASYNYSPGKENSTPVVSNEKIDNNLTFHLYDCYPNPFNPVTNIKFSIPIEAKVILSVYNMLGEKVCDLLNQNLSAGTYNYKFNATNLSSGMYIYKLTVGRNVVSKKMLLIK